MKKKILALFLSVLMLLSAVPMHVVYAIEDEPLGSEALYDALLAAKTLDEFSALLEKNLPDEEAGETFLASFTDEELDALVQKSESFSEECEHEAVNYADVAPFVKKTPAKKLKAPMKSAPIKGNQPEGMKMTKTVTPTGNGYVIQLEVYTTGEITSTEKVEPCDIILVLDRSSSMKSQFSSTTYNYTEVYESDLNKNRTYYISKNSTPTVSWCSRCKAWTTGCSWFIITHRPGTKYDPKDNAADTTGTQFYTIETVDPMDRMDALHLSANNFVDSVKTASPDSRIAVVSFGKNAYRHTGTGNSTALLNVNDNATAIHNAINGISADESATEQGRGMELAKDIFSSSDYNGNRRVVILITDGEPAPSGTNNWSSRVVKQTLDNSYELKNTYGASVYCVSVMPNSNAENPTSDFDKYMSYVSSNYQNARYTGTNLDNKSNNGDSYYNGATTNILNQITPGTKTETEGSFYLSANDIETLHLILEKISSQTGGTSVSLGSSATVRDIVTPSFNMPANASAVRVEEVECLSYDDETKAATWAETGVELEDAVTISGSNIDVTGFDFDGNFIASTGRLEGDPTKPGNFHGKKLVITFTITGKDGNVENVDEEGNTPTNGSASGVYTEDGGTTPVGTFDVPTVPTNKVETKIVRFDAAGTKIETSDAISELHILPGKSVQISVEDIVVDTYRFDGWYTDEACTIPLSTPNTSKLRTVTSAEGGVTYYAKYVPDIAAYTVKHILVEPDGTENEQTADTETKSGTIGTQTQAAAKTYENYTARAVEQKTIEADGSTVVTIRYDRQLGTLTVGKTGMESGETAIFVITGRGIGGSGLRIAVENGKTVTVTNLWVGETYTVTEEDAWTWRYTADTASKTATLTETNKDASVSFTNTKNKTTWLDAFDYVKNLFNGNN